MCGINGFNFADEARIRAMNQATAHRGPDGAGVAVTKQWSLGHNRLAIIDLSDAGRQPMYTAEGDLAIVFNGEIYNFLAIRQELEKKGHRFHSRTDTEVVLYAYREWGADCVKRFNGIFAFAILEVPTGDLFLARDHMGVKPLYYYQRNGRFIFSSEVKAIVRHADVERKLNGEALNIYFRFLYVPSPLTVWHYIHKVPPAHCAKVSADGRIALQRYWSVPEYEDMHEISAAEIAGNVRALLQKSIALQQVSDRPLGVFLSGGIDSTIIAGMMSEQAGNVRTFSVGFDVEEEAEKYNRDFYTARRTAQHFKTDHHELVVRGRDIADHLAETAYHMDEPVSNHVQAVNLLLARFAAQEVRVVLGGDGADELFGGYERYYYNELINRAQRLLPRAIRDTAAARLLATLAGKESALQALNTAPGINRYLLFFAQKEALINTILRPAYNRPAAAGEWFAQRYFPAEKEAGSTAHLMAVDLQTWLPDESLLRSDKLSMAAGLEQRVPFLDYRLVEYAARIPTAMKVGAKGMHWGSVGGGYQGKEILRRACQPYLPDFVLENPKWGWFSPAAKWLRGPLRPLAEEALSPGFCADTADMFDFKALRALYDDHRAKRRYALTPLWSVITFQLWYQKMQL